MARRVMGNRNPLRDVRCGECGAALQRRTLHPRTYQPLSAFYCDLACKAATQRRARPVSDDWLRQKYLVEALDCVEIGRIVDRDPKRVWEWLREAGIPTRPRGALTTGAGFKKGQPSAFKGRSQLKGSNSPFWKGGITPLRQAFCASPEWRAAERETYSRARKRCERCGASQKAIIAAGEKMHVHHALGFQVETLRADPANLVLLCAPCHRFVHSNRNTEGLFLAQEIAA